MIGRTALITPAHVPGMINSIVAVSSDSIIFDLENSVPPEEKDAARILLREALKSLDFLKEKNIIIRVNDPASDLFDADIEEVVPLGNYPLVLPGASADSIAIADRKIKAIETRSGLNYRVSIIPTIRTPQELESINEMLKSSGRITGAIFESEGFLSKDNHLSYVRSRIAVACRTAGIEALDAPFPDIEDVEGLMKEATIARQIGFTGKIAIHSSQVETIQEVFTPPQEKQWNTSQEKLND